MTAVEDNDANEEEQQQCLMLCRSSIGCRKKDRVAADDIIVGHKVQ